MSGGGEAAPPAGEPAPAEVDGGGLEEPETTDGPVLLRSGPVEELPVPPLAARARAVLAAPWQAFAQHDARWGWAGPWLLVSAIGVVFGLIYVSQVDLAELQRVEFERSLEAMPAAQQAQVEAAREQIDTGMRFMAFFSKVAAIAGPPLLGLAAIVVWGLVAFGAARLLAPEGRRPEPLRCISMAAHVHLTQGFAYVAALLGVLGGNAVPQTGPAALVDRIDHALLHALLGRLDPVTLFGYVLFAAGLVGSCGLARRQALAVTAAAWGVVTALATLVNVTMGG